MNIRVQLFAAAREQVGAESVDVELPEGATVADLQAWLIANEPRLADIVQQSRFAVSAQFASPDAVLNDAAEVALIPPVSGG